MKTNLLILLVLSLLLFGLWSIADQRKSHLELGVKQEETEKPLMVKGEFPKWLDGALVRNSSVPIYEDGKQISHPFDGLAMLHGFNFQQGQVFYTNRFLVSIDYQAIQNGKTFTSGFAKAPTLWETIKSFFSAPTAQVQNAQVNVFKYGNSRYVALTEAPLPVRFDLKTLQTLGSFHYQDSLPQNRIWESAHPHFDRSSKDIVNYFIEFGPQSYYVFYRMPFNSSVREVIAKIPVDLPSYMHSFAMTEHYLILTEFPLTVHPFDLMLGKSFMESMQWESKKNTRFLVVDRRSGQVMAQGETAPIFCFHHANAYEEGDEIILDLVAFPDISKMQHLFSHAATSSSDRHSSWLCRLMRYHFSLSKSLISEDVLLEKNVEFPRFHDALDGKKYRYLYLTLSEEETGGLAKFDHQTREIKTWQMANCYAVEPVFVPAPHAKQEDEGIVLTIVCNQKEKTSFLLALDGQSFIEIARATLPFYIPPSFHGQYFSESLFIE